MSAPLVSLHGIGVRFGPTTVLRDIDLEIEPGTTLGVTGANGAGKSTLLEVVATLVRPSEGHGSILGVPFGDRELRLVRRRIGLAAHDPGLYPELTLIENLELIERLAGEVRMSARQALDVVGLDLAADRRAAAASNGMRRRIDLARLLMTRPDLLLLDEAHTGLDRAARAIIDRLIDLTRRAGGAAVVVSHDPDVLSGTVDRIVAVKEGRLA